MDPVTAIGLLAALVQLIDKTVEVTQYLNHVRNAPKERTELSTQILNLQCVLFLLRDRLEEADPEETRAKWFLSIQALAQKNGPIDQFKEAIERLQKKLKPADSGIKRFGKALIWTIEKEQVKKILHDAESLKSNISLALLEDQFSLTLAVKADTTAIGRNVESVAADVKSFQAVISDKESLMIMDWLAPLDFRSTKDTFLSQKQEGTGKWFLESAKFQAWVSGSKNTSTLCCPGNPGAGKTFIASTAIEYLEAEFDSDSNTAVAYIYMQHEKHQSQTTINLIASIWKQLVRSLGSLPQDARNLYAQHAKQGSRSSIIDMFNLLESVSSEFSKVFVVIDAFDECRDDDSRAELYKLLTDLTTAVNILITSRFINLEAFEFKGMTEMRLSTDEEDVRRYVSNRVTSIRALRRRSHDDETLRNEIINKVVENSKDMFLLARFHIDSLGSKKSPNEVRKALKNLPKQLDGTYDEAVKRIKTQNEDDMELAMKILAWLSHAMRPLSIKELQHALAVQIQASEFDEDDITDEGFLVPVCVGLIDFDPETDSIRWTHYTTQDYFVRFGEKLFPNAHKDIAMTCLTYISFDEFSTGPCLDDMEMDKRLKDYPFYSYAAKNWGKHARGQVELELKDTALEFLKQIPTMTASVQVLTMISSYKPEWYAENLSGLSLAISFGLEDLASFLLNESDITTRDKNGDQAIQWASRKGNNSVLRLLLRKGADVNAQDEGGNTALHYACEAGHQETVRLLIDNAANLDSGVALEAAARNGHEKIVQQLLDVGANIEQMSWARYTPLCSAASSGHLGVVRLLLKNKANIEAGGSEGSDTSYRKLREYIRFNPRTALHLAAHSGRSEVVELLLKNGAQVMARNCGEGTALHHAASRGCEVTVQILMDNGADIDARMCTGETALHLAVRNASQAVTSLLLQARAAVEWKTTSKYSWGRGNTGLGTGGLTALHRATIWGSKDGIKLLVQYEANINEGDDEGRTALHWAVSDENQDMVQLLLEQKINANATDISGQSALHLAVKAGETGLIMTLLEGGSDIYLGDHDGVKPFDLADEHNKSLMLAKAGPAGITCAGRPLNLRGAVMIGDLASLRMLLQSGVELDEQIYDDKPILHLAALQGNREVVDLLVEAGGDPDCRDSRGNTALHKASSKGHVTAVRSLLDAGATINAENVRKETALFQAVKSEQEAVAELLLKRGANPNTEKYGVTPLHYAATHGNERLLLLLLECGAIIDVAGSKGISALGWAASKKKLGVVRLLLGKGADVNFQGTRLRKTPLDVAYEAPVKQILKDAGGKYGRELKKVSASTEG